MCFWALSIFRVLAVVALVAAPSGCVFDQDGIRLELDLVFPEVPPDAFSPPGGS